MLWVPQKGIVRVETNLSDTSAASPGTAVAGGSTADAKGTPVEIFAATAFDAYYVSILAMDYGASATQSRGCLDILIGASTEEVLIPNLLFGFAGDNNGDRSAPKRWDFPLYIPAGSRIAAQQAGDRTTSSMRIVISLRGGNGYPPFRVGSKVTTYGIGTVPAGTALTIGTSGAAGAWAQISAGTSEDHFAFVPSLQFGAETSTNSANFITHMGIGAATEEVIGGPYMYAGSTVEQIYGPINSEPTFHDVPSGTRLVQRVTTHSSTSKAFDGAIHGVS